MNKHRTKKEREAIQVEVNNLIAQGVSRTKACRRTGVSNSTFTSWTKTKRTDVDVKTNSFWKTFEEANEFTTRFSALKSKLKTEFNDFAKSL